MTERPAVPSLRTIRTFAFSASACTAALCLSVGGWAAPASASGSAAPAPAAAGVAPQARATGAGGPASPASLQIQAQELAGEIEADGRTLDELDASYNAAQIQLQSLDTRMAAVQAGMARTARMVSLARRALKEQAVLAYLSGGAPLIYLPDHPGQDPSLSEAYAEIIVGGQERAATAYRTDLKSMSRQSATLEATQRQVGATLSAIRSDQARAATTMASQKQALAQVTGRMAVLVSQVEQTQQQATAPTGQGTAAVPGTTQPTGGGAVPTPLADPATGAGPTAPSTTRPPATNAPPATTRLLIAPTVGARPAPTATTATTAPTTTATSTPAAGPSASSPTSGSGTGPVPPQAPGANAALAYARAQLGKPYQWAGAGPDSFDCSGLVMMAWDQGGVRFPHLAQDQYDMTARIPVSQALPGDLVFFGTPDNVYHVGIYIGNGQMIDAPETGQNVSIQSVYWSSLLGAGRVHS